MYVFFLGPRKFAISKALLTYLDYDVEEFALEAAKFRAVFAEYLDFKIDFFLLGVIQWS